MSTSPVSFLNSTYLQSILGTTPKSTGVSGASSSQQPDSGQLSPFAQLMSTLQQLQESNPTQYKDITQQIATNLQNAAQTATQDGNTSMASELNTLATDFTNASQSGQLPNISDLAQAIGGGGHHHHHHGYHAESSDSSSSSSSSSTDSTSSPLQQLLAAFQSNATQNEALSPMSIITNTLASAGIAN